MGNIPVDASSFALWLHQNAPNNCEEIEEAVALLDDLGAADIMKTDDDIVSPPRVSFVELHSDADNTVAEQYPSYSLRSAHQRSGLPDGSALARSQVSFEHVVSHDTYRTSADGYRRCAKVTKPQFFQSYKDQRKNNDLVDVASAYVTKKAVAASNILAEQTSFAVDKQTDLGAWGGMMSQSVLAAEVLPMMVKMQDLTARTSLRRPARHNDLRLITRVELII